MESPIRLDFFLKGGGGLTKAEAVAGVGGWVPGWVVVVVANSTIPEQGLEPTVNPQTPSDQSLTCVCNDSQFITRL